MVWLKIKDGDFQFSSFTPLWQVKEWSLSHTAQCGILGPLLELAFLLGRQLGLRLTQDQLRQRGWKMSNRCYVCRAKEETGDHLLLHCPKASTLWQLVCALFHIQWVMHSSVREVLLSWNGVPIGKKRQKAWKVAPLCIFWSIWRERNRRAFEDKECLDQSFKSSFLYLFCDWVRVYMGDSITSLIEFVDWLSSP